MDNTNNDYPGCPLRTDDEIAELAFDVYKHALGQGMTRTAARAEADKIVAELLEENRQHAAKVA